MLSRSLPSRACPAALALIATLTYSDVVQIFAKPSSVMPQTVEKKSSRPTRSLHRVYEDGEVRVSIPTGWRILKTGRPDDPLAAHPVALPQTFIPAPGNGLLLTRGGYTLAIAYKASHASPLSGGRIMEVLNIPWLSDVSDGWSCSGYLRSEPQPVNERLLFINLIFGSLSPEAREQCSIPENVSTQGRWFAGYFTTASGQYYFDSDDVVCAQKVYTLTSGALTPDQLPNVDDPDLQTTIHEAIKTVASIRYKRCPPASNPAPLAY